MEKIIKLIPISESNINIKNELKNKDCPTVFFKLIKNVNGNI